jgi:hypothetical protein
VRRSRQEQSWLLQAQFDFEPTSGICRKGRSSHPSVITFSKILSGIEPAPGTSLTLLFGVKVVFH